jgi:hypothetical protein
MNNFEPITPAMLETELGVDPKAVRAWLRMQGWRSSAEKGEPWHLTAAQVAAAREHFAVVVDPGGPPLFDASSLSVGALLGAYAAILVELRRRGLVRTNNAPVGDLAEYACSVVYGGALAPNSEKSYDLIAGDGRRIQVKVRNLRGDTRPSSAFSPLRSFDFDACAFVLVDEVEGRVAAAFEWTAQEVRDHGVHRAHTNGTVVRVRQVRSGVIGTDITAEVASAWRAMLEMMG